MSENLIGATTAVFPIRLSVAVSTTVDVEWSTRDGSAVAGSDYKAAAGTVTFLPGETEKQIEVQVYGQSITPADDKVFFIRLNPPSNAVLVDAILTCTINIIDDQGVPSVAVVVAEGRRGPKGDPGLSAYEQAVLMGYTGTLAEWMDQIADASKAADRAGDYAISASEDALKAQNAAKNAVFAGVVFPTAAEGVNPILGVNNGAYFNVRSPLSEHYIDEYQNVNGVAVATGKSYPTSDHVQNISEHTALPFVTGTLYKLNKRVALTNGDIVKSTIDGNANDPNVNMTGWVNSNSASQIFDESGLSQQEWNNGVESIADLLTISNPKNGSRVFASGFQGDWFKYNPLNASINNGHSIFNGWERQVPYLHVSPLQWGADPTGQNDSTAAFKSFRDHLQYMVFNSTFPPVACIPAGYYVVRDEIEFYDLSNCTIYSLGAMIGYVGSKVSASIIKINNAVNTKILGSLTLTAWGQDNAQCGLLITASTGSLLQADGIANHIDIIGVTARNLVCGFQIGEDLQDYDKHVAELHFIGCNTMVCRTAVRNYGSQTESSFDGCTLASGFFKETDTSIYHALLDIRGGIVTVNGGSIVNSMLPNTFINSQGIVVKPAKSTLYSNPYPVVAINATHIELTTQLLSIEHGGQTTNLSAISNVSIQDCKGWMGMLPSEALIRIWDSSYVGKLSIGSSNNFYTSLNRTGKNIICDAPNAILDVSSMAFGMQMQQGFGSIVGGILKHPLKLISQTIGLNSSLATGKQPIIFTTVNGADDLARYKVYYTANGNIQFPHKVKSINIKVNIVDPGINVVGDIFIEKNGAIVCFANKNAFFATMDYTDNDVLSTDVYRVYFNKTGAVTLLSGSVSNISIFAET